MCTERLIGNVLKGFGDLYSIFSFPRSNKMNGIQNVGVRKLGWTTSTGLFKVRMMFGTYSGDGGLGDSSFG